MVTNAMEKGFKDGVIITIEEAESLSLVEGIQFDRGFLPVCLLCNITQYG